MKLLSKLLISILLILTTINASETIPTQEEVAKLYVATFNRAPDSAGLSYWVNDSGLTLSGIARSFFVQTETQALYPAGTTVSAFIQSVYHNLFNRAPKSAGLSYWEDDFNLRGRTRESFILAMINGALDTADGMDKTILNNKNEVGLYFANAGLGANNSPGKIMSGVTADRSTVTSAQSNIDELVSNSTQYSWFEGEWGTCRGLIGENSADQIRTVTCKDLDGKAVSDSYCTDVKPITTKVCTMEENNYIAYDYLWKKSDWDARYNNYNNTVEYNEATQTFTLSAHFQETDTNTGDSVDERDSRSRINAGTETNNITSVFAHIKPTQVNQYSKIATSFSVDLGSVHFNSSIYIYNNRIKIYGDFENEDYSEEIDFMDYELATFPEGVTNKRFDVSISIVDNTMVYQVIDLDNSEVYKKIVDFSTDIGNEATMFYRELTGEAPSIERKTARQVSFMSRTDYRYGGDASLGTSTVAEIDYISIVGTSIQSYIDAYGYRWENYKYTRGDARYFGDENRVNFNPSANVFTLEAGFKETDTDTQDTVDERNSRSRIRIKDFDNPVTSVNVTLKPIQMNQYSSVQLNVFNWNQEEEYISALAALSVEKDGVYIYLGYYADNTDVNFLDENIKLLDLTNNVENKLLNLDIRIVDNSIIYTVKNLNTNEIASKTIDLSTDLSSSAVISFMNTTGKVPSVQNLGFNFENIYSKTDYTNGGDANLGGTTIMEVYDFEMSR